ncbi:RDD family [Actinomyces bovis]|uniref:RDD family n=1 Tax=Actinomyces bovis TaxID=1658 RepID=A0ABY1VMI9_9ACTO|nr:RDD family protein [Actinomyces bovis]SPT53326.1 RDD family [Actinomyces bovis]VEG52676.1 RDD family [Actinomyces israelii]
METSSERRIEQERMVTGEAVVLDVVPATVGSRLLSGAIDYGIMGAGTALSLATFISLAPANTTVAAATTIAALIMVFWAVAVPVTVETLSRGRSAGRLVVGTRVVRDDGGAVRLRHSLVRALVAVVEVALTSGVLAICACIVARRGKRLGDLLAGTYVIHERATAKSAPPLLMPPELAEWAHGTDLHALPGHLALVTRSFLQRTTTLDPVARQRIATSLAQQVLPLVAPPPPASTHPERFLAAVLVERRNRELALAQRDLQFEERLRASESAPAYSLL